MRRGERRIQITAYIYIVPLDCDFSLMPRGSTAFSRGKAAPCAMVERRGFVPCPDLGQAEEEQGQGVRRSPCRAQGKAPVLGGPRSSFNISQPPKVEGRKREASIY